jgi:enterochelin esterase-like enzyme/outer membrane protein assembly factor BamB
VKQLTCALLLLLLSTPLLAGSWPHTRGPQQDGRIVTEGTFGDSVGLEKAWQVPVGSAYSGIAVENDKAVTLFTDGEADWMGAFDVKQGKELWRFRLGDPTKGKDGSDDGPLSSPTIGGGRVFALGADGRLVAVKLEDGSLVWDQQIATVFGAEAPSFGFTSTPLFVDGVVILQAGGKDGKSVVGLDATDGKRRWARGDGKVDYQSPAAMTLAGERTVVVVDGTGISGLSPRDGKTLWEMAFGEGERAGSANPAYLGEDRFAVGVSGKTRVIRVSRGGDGFELETLYESEALGRNYAPPVLHDGHLYGFRGQVLTCVDAASGERVWRSREPGGDGLILVDDHLVIFGAKGNVVVAKASSAGYEERARVQALEGSSLTWPSFADGLVFVRNLKSMAAVRIGAGGASDDTEETGAHHEFGRWILEARKAGDPQQMVDAYFAGRPGGPIVEGRHVHFVHRADAEDVSIFGSMINNEAPQAMDHLDGTDLFYSTFELEPGGRWEYAYQVDFENWIHDAGNPRTVPAVDGGDTWSELVTDGYELGAHLGEPEGDRGILEELKLDSKILGYEKNVRVWTPPGYAKMKKAKLPLIVVNDGAAWLDRGRLDRTLDNLTGNGVAPAVVAFVDAHRRWWTEGGGTRTEDYARMLVEELLPTLRKKYKIAKDPESHSLIGNRFFAATAVYTTLAYPDSFGKAGLQSAYRGLGIGDTVEELITSADTDAASFYLDWNKYDERNIDRDYDFAVDSRRLQGMLRDAGFEVAGGEALDSRGWGGWRNRSAEMLKFLVPEGGS